MPLVEPSNRREKIVLVAPAKQGKTSAWLSIAWWAFKSGDQRKFFVIDTDQAVLDVMDEPKYEGMLAEDGGNIHHTEVVGWDEYVEAGDKIMSQVTRGDWIVIDFLSHAWPAVQEDYTLSRAGKTRGETLSQAGKRGLSGWDMYKEDFNWSAINGEYFDWLQPINLKSGAHLFFTAEQDEIRESGNMTEDAKNHLRDFGKYKAVGQKKIAYNCRSYLRLQRLARGRVLYTLGDRAREEMSGMDMSPDFFKSYLEKVAGWKVVSPEDA